MWAEGKRCGLVDAGALFSSFVHAPNRTTSRFKQPHAFSLPPPPAVEAPTKAREEELSRARRARRRRAATSRTRREGEKGHWGQEGGLLQRNGGATTTLWRPAKPSTSARSLAYSHQQQHGAAECLVGESRPRIRSYMYDTPEQEGMRRKKERGLTRSLRGCDSRAALIELRAANAFLDPLLPHPSPHPITSTAKMRGFTTGASRCRWFVCCTTLTAESHELRRCSQSHAQTEQVSLSIGRRIECEANKASLPASETVRSPNRLALRVPAADPRLPIPRQSPSSPTVRSSTHVFRLAILTSLIPVDHGKSTLTDSLLAKAGLLATSRTGGARGLDTRADEQARGITIKSTAVSMHFTIEKDLIKDIKQPVDGACPLPSSRQVAVRPELSLTRLSWTSQ